MEVRPATRDDLPAIRALLEASALPAADVDGEGAQRLLVAREDGRLAGCIGLEVHGDAGLLRSFAVAPPLRRRGIGAALHDAAVVQARTLGVRDLYVLTTTVKERALRTGFEEVAREQVPEALRAGAQFRSLCPASAACLRLRLG
ncbi:MAG: arsenic resistance N-acetyltransferase ArsN2 [Anaeromyxobacteraceae bacterium]